MSSAHVDTFARDRLPPPERLPEFVFDLPGLRFPAQLNCATELLDKPIAAGRGDRICIRAPGGIVWTWRELQDKADRIAHVLVGELGVVPGNRVLLRSFNNPMLAACWFAVMKAGAIAVATMPLLRAKELQAIVEIGQASHALVDEALAAELDEAAKAAPVLRHVLRFNVKGEGGAAREHGLEAAMARHDAPFLNVDTAVDDTCLFGFTSGTTGVPKATMHFHRDVMAACACWPPHVLRATQDDVFIGSPPLGFTFGLGGLLVFPMSIGASTVLIEKAAPANLVDGIRDFGATVLFTAPTSYRALAARGDELRATKLRKCVSAGEVLPASTRTLWREATGIELIDGIGSTELLHIFISADEANARPGATGTAVPGYRAEVVDDEGRAVPDGTVGRLRVKGPTGCRYLADERQSRYVQDGWNVTGDAYWRDDDGYFHYHARTDDMIISAGYNIGAPEVEDALLDHPAVADCAVIGAADAERGQIVKAFVIARAGNVPGPELVRQLQDFVKRAIAPYKYPRAIVFVDTLPRTANGKLQRYKLHDTN